MNTCLIESGLNQPMCSPTKAVNIALESPSKVSGVALNAMAIIGILNLSLLNMFFNPSNGILNKDRPQVLISSWVLGGTNSLYYLMHSKQSEENLIANSLKKMNFRGISDYLITKCVSAQPPLIACALFTLVFSGELFELMSTACFTMSYFTGLGSSLYSIADAVVYDITKLIGLNTN